MKSCEEVIRTAGESKEKLIKSLGVLELVMLGIGAIVGAGIFVITGTAAAGDISVLGQVIRYPAGPAIMLSFAITAIGCCFCAMCYAELSSMIPVSGSAYTYSYVSLGEIVAWIIGWCLLLEYTFESATVAIGWAGYLKQFLEHALHVSLPDYLLKPTLACILHPELYPTLPRLFGIPISINLPAAFVVAAISLLLIAGVKKSTRFNNIVVGMKLIIIFIVIFVGAFYVDPKNWVPFMPYGVKGVLSGASMIFLAYIGFDAISTASEEVKNPGRDLPLGIIISLGVCTFLYIVVSGVLTGIIPYNLLNTPEPVATAFNYIGQNFLAAYIFSVGAVIALLSTLLVFLYGQPRIILAMARDGFFPKSLAKVHPKYHTPYVASIISGTVVMIIAGTCDISEVAALCNAGTLMAFSIVCLSVIILRYKNPDLPRKFRAPLVPLFPILGILICTTLFFSLPRLSLITFFGWTGAGLLYYFLYGIKHTKYDTK